MIARFDDMATPYAALVWGRVLPLTEIDTAQILDFYAIWGEQTNPEKLCEVPSPAPSVGATPEASPSAASPGTSLAASGAPSGDAPTPSPSAS